MIKEFTNYEKQKLIQTLRKNDNSEEINDSLRSISCYMNSLENLYNYIKSTIYVYYIFPKHKNCVDLIPEDFGDAKDIELELNDLYDYIDDLETMFKKYKSTTSCCLVDIVPYIEADFGYSDVSRYHNELNVNRTSEQKLETISSYFKRAIAFSNDIDDTINYLKSFYTFYFESFKKLIPNLELMSFDNFCYNKKPFEKIDQSNLKSLKEAYNEQFVKSFLVQYKDFNKIF